MISEECFSFWKECVTWKMWCVFFVRVTKSWWPWSRKLTEKTTYFVFLWFYFFSIRIDDSVSIFYFHFFFPSEISLKRAWLKVSWKIDKVKWLRLHLTGEKLFFFLFFACILCDFFDWITCGRIFLVWHKFESFSDPMHGIFMASHKINVSRHDRSESVLMSSWFIYWVN